jgi:hypothetical protein
MSADADIHYRRLSNMHIQFNRLSKSCFWSFLVSGIENVYLFSGLRSTRGRNLSAGSVAPVNQSEDELQRIVDEQRTTLETAKFTDVGPFPPKEVRVQLGGGVRESKLIKDLKKKVKREIS